MMKALCPLAFFTLLVSCTSNGRKNLNLDDVYVDIGSPRYWTLDDAHYLLAGMHERTRDITLQTLSGLDPNEFNSSKITEVQSLLKVSASYDEFSAAKNELELKKLEEVQEQNISAKQDVQEIEEKLSVLRDDHLASIIAESESQSEIDIITANRDYETSKISRLKEELTSIDTSIIAAGDSDTSELKKRRESVVEDIKKSEENERKYTLSLNEENAKKKNFTSQKDAKNAEIDRLESELTSAQGNVKDGSITLSPPQANLPTPPTVGSSSASSNVFLSAINEALNNKNNDIGLIPSLSVSERITNHIDSETELLARQLTLLRNEVNDDETVIFLELPHSIHSSSKSSANRNIQIEWVMESYCKGDIIFDDEKPLDVDRPFLDAAQVKSLPGATGLLSVRSLETKGANLEDIEIQSLFATELNKRDADLPHHTPKERLDKACNAENGLVSISNESSQEVGWSPRSWDLIPKVNAYNTAEFNLQQKEYNLAAFFSSITGIGAEAGYSKKKSMFEQFAQQNVFATAYGQGKSTFGWVMSPKPGVRHVSSGTKSTFATLILPKQATAIKLKSRYCLLKGNTTISKSTSSGSRVCSEYKSHGLVIAKNYNFYISEINYGAVSPDRAATIIIVGKNFSPFQIDVLVDGNPLEPYNGTDRAKRSLSDGATSFPKGSYEVTKDTITINLKMPSDYEGTPEITLVTPTKSLKLNNQLANMSIAGGLPSYMASQLTNPMFQKNLRLTSATVEQSPLAQNRDILIHGQGFSSSTDFEVNGTGAVSTRVLSGSEAVITVPNADEWIIVAKKEMVYGIEADRLKLTSTENAFSVVNVDVIYSDPVDSNIWKMGLIINGHSFESSLVVDDSAGQASISNTNIVSENQLYLEVESDRDRVLLKFSQGTKSVLHPVTIAKTPSINEVSNPSNQDKNSGAKGGGYVVLIKGKNLNNIEQVLFGANQATISTKSDSVLAVVAPPGSGKVPIIVESKGMINGNKLSNATGLSYFEYND